MSAILDVKVTHTSAAKPATTDIYYTICPVFAASNVALELGWIDEELKKVGAKLNYLFSGADDAHYLPHFSHRHENLFRDGGNIPSIWAKADNTDTTLVALTWSRQGGNIVVRADSGITRVAELKGRKFALYQSDHSGKVDWWRATADRGIELAFQLHGLTRQDIQFVNTADEDRPWGDGGKPADVWAQRTIERKIYGPEGVALRDGKVDALYTSEGRAQTLAATGQFKVIEDLGRNPDWTLQVNNSPYALTVNTALVTERPDVVTAYLRAALRAALWINAHRDAAATILHRTTFYPSVAATAKAIAETNFIPDLSPRNLAGIEITKKFLLKHGYIKRDFNVKDWANATFLEEAARTL